MNIHWFRTRDKSLECLNWEKGTLEYFIHNPADATDTKTLQKAVEKLQEAIQLIEQTINHKD